MNGHHPVVNIDGKSLTLEDVVAVARSNTRVEIRIETKHRLMDTSRDLKDTVEGTLAWVRLRTKKDKEAKGFGREMKRRMIYGTTTGFGELKTKYIKEPKKAKDLQRNIVLSHASGVGPELDRDTIRAIMLLRANTLASGYSGVRPIVVEQLAAFLNADVYPSIPEQGSVGASGDLAPLAHLALGLIGEGRVNYRKTNKKSTQVLPFDNLAKLKDEHPGVGVRRRIQLSYKEGLALVNGLTVMTGIAALAFADARNLLEWADVIGAATLEGILGSSRAFDKLVFTVYEHEGASTSAGNVRGMIAGSALINQSTDVHDPYSVRCIPQVHGAVRDALGYVGTTLRHQLNSVDDDPIIFSAIEMISRDNEPMDGWLERKHFEQGNFHGEPVAFAMDLLAIAAAELGSISERRIQMLLDKHHNRDLPACLVDNPAGVNSGYMIAQYTAAALVSENKGLCHPASVDSIPTSANTEDHVSMGTIAARKARRVIENVRNILAIELLCSTEALSYRLKDQKVTTDPKAKEKRAVVTGECGIRTRLLYDSVRKGNTRIELLKGRDVILHKLIDRARNEFLTKSPSEFIGD
jgi:histidine ammonia-lyase